ncbi:MAG: nucleic acid/nucleotide deaminase domain-containing protein [Candidatus Thiodiazotropha sp. (ex Epidulcina cf. delphinae)]|nr:nucleic acid/nucleotide deaminase domain-containing protein [Candidatus Thiodiazotropha sp. (ex Epidulcina cf. delphinae)]
MGRKTKPILITKKVQKGPIKLITNNLSNLDLIAIAIHRCYWRGKPSLVNMGTVAVVQVKNDLWYAVNVLKALSTQDVIKAHSMVSQFGGKISPYYVYLDKGEGDDKKTHAEMKLLYQLDKEGKTPNKGHMGISKPACQYCYQTLKKNNISVSWHHKRQVVSWDYPRINKSKLINFQNA